MAVEQSAVVCTHPQSSLTVDEQRAYFRRYVSVAFGVDGRVVCTFAVCQIYFPETFCTADVGRVRVFGNDERVEGIVFLEYS